MRTTRRLLYVLIFVVATTTAAAASLCTGGDAAVLHVQSGNCSYRQLSFESNAIPFCMVAYKVTTAQNTLVFTPISTANYTYTGPYGYKGFVDCQTASGKARVLDPTKPKQATLQLWRDWSRESVIEAIGSSSVQITTYDVPLFRTAPINCRFQYKVTSGCLLGAKAPPALPITCPAGSARKKGRGGALYCEPCAYGFYAAADAASCTACPVEAKLGTLPLGLRPQCPSCILGGGPCSNGCEGDNVYKDAVKGCTKCPAGSSLTPALDGCSMCVEGRRCCVKNPSAACPACPPGFKGQDTSFTIIATGVKGLPWQRCQVSSVYQCFQRTKVTVHSNCSISLRPSTPPGSSSFLYELDGLPLPRQPAQPATGSSLLTCDAVVSTGLLYGSDGINNAGAFNLEQDVLSKIFRADYTTRATKALVSPVGPYFEVAYKGTSCQPRFRVVEATHPAILAPLTLTSSCPAAAAECKKPCPAGSYVTQFPGGPSTCQPCPPATYSTAPNSASCKKCGPGQAAFGVGNTRCRTCPAGTTSRGSICESCYNAWTPPGSSSGACSYCPEGTTSVASGCITKYGPSPCCYVGTCGPFPKCTTSDPPPAAARVGALLKLTSSSAACSSTPLIGCMAKGGLMYASSYDASGYFGLNLLGGSRTGPLCRQRAAVEVANGVHDGPQAFTFITRLGTPGPWALGGNTYYGTATATSKPLGLSLTIYQTGYAIGATAAPTVCTATLQLVNGVLLGMKKKRAGSCPSGLFPKTYGGVDTCESCGDAKKFYGGQCVDCHPGTFNYEPNRTYCTTCPVGSYAPGGYSECYSCGSGSVPNPQQTNCGPCPVNTYAPIDAAACKPCASGTTTRNKTNSGFCWF